MNRNSTQKWPLHQHLWAILSPLLWFWLCGQKSQSGNFQLSDLEANYSGPAVVPTSFYVMVFFAVSAAVGGFFGLRYYRTRQEQMEQLRISRDKIERTLSTLYESLKMAEDEVELVRRLGHNREADDILSLMRSNKLFEDAVEELHQNEELDEETLAGIQAMRQKLQFTVSNRDCEVVTTKMFLSNMRVECQVTAKGKQLGFISLIKEVSERGVRIDPPMIKRKPANLRQFKVIRCRVRRNGDADYEFTLPVIEQKTETPSVVWLGHSRDIRKMAIRESERLDMNQKAKFRRMDPADYDVRERLHRLEPSAYKLEGTILDMSAGGIKLSIGQKLDEPLKQGDILLFHLPGASLREDLAATVLATIPRGKQMDVHMKFQDSNPLTRIKLLQFLHRVKKQRSAAA